ncbi:unnamed protein product [Danaus chrysippus]|uniref:(African queen) hypothetical protein n=1 Tax=Danaus chrysippus TaxID=151541 RepID=A0A8J2W2D2_9NEOP|nr:unnamed protein product [Danaus chrysippus]
MNHELYVPKIRISTCVLAYGVLAYGVLVNVWTPKIRRAEYVMAVRLLTDRNEHNHSQSKNMKCIQCWEM